MASSSNAFQILSLSIEMDDKIPDLVPNTMSLSLTGSDNYKAHIKAIRLRSEVKNESLNTGLPITKLSPSPSFYMSPSIDSTPPPVLNLPPLSSDSSHITPLSVRRTLSFNVNVTITEYVVSSPRSTLDESSPICEPIIK